MNKELKIILDYILKVNNVPKEALQRTKRNKIFMFGKNLHVVLSSCVEDISIEVFPNTISRKKIMELTQNENHNENEFTVWIRKTPYISDLSFFKKEDFAKFELKIFEDDIMVQCHEEKNVTSC